MAARTVSSAPLVGISYPNPDRRVDNCQGSLSPRNKVLSDGLDIRNVDTMLAKVRRWGNSLAVRIPKQAASKLRISEGDIVTLEISEKRYGERGVDLHNLPTFQDEDREASLHHDQYLYAQRRQTRRY